MAYDKDNIFARIVRGEIPCHKVYEDADTIAFMDIMPQAEGHTLIVPKAAGEDLFTTPPESVAAAIRTTQKVARAIKKAFSAARRHGRAAERARRGAERLPPALPRDPALCRQGPQHPCRGPGGSGGARRARGAHPRGALRAAAMPTNDNVLFYQRVLGVGRARSSSPILVFRIIEPFLGPIAWALFLGFLLQPTAGEAGARACAAARRSQRSR